MENQLQNFKKYSRTGSIISAAGLIVILLSVVIFIYFDREKENKITTTENQLIQKDSLTTMLNDSLNIIKQIINEDKVECNATLLNARMADGNPLYVFTLKIKDSLIISKLSSVDYFFAHSSFNPRLKTSKDAKNNFKLSYKGWGCLDTVQVYLHYKESLKTDTSFKSPKTDTIIFRMCDKTKIELKPQ